MTDSECIIFLRKLTTCKPSYLMFAAVLIMGLVVASALKRKLTSFQFLKIFQVPYYTVPAETLTTERLTHFPKSSRGLQRFLVSNILIIQMPQSQNEETEIAMDDSTEFSIDFDHGWFSN